MRQISSANLPERHSVPKHSYIDFGGENFIFGELVYRRVGQWRNYGRQWRQPPQGASPEGAPRDQCQKKFLTPHRLTMQSRHHDQ